jgi:hypothetical protein
VKYKGFIESGLQILIKSAARRGGEVLYEPERPHDVGTHSFYPCMEYFTKNEQDVMLDEIWEFDRKMIHEKYTKVVDFLKGRD